MRLDRLEISGFKSFPDRADLTFDRGVTAIVGPNGCGKSNVVDAITWVLGEQSAKSLRGDRMEDVIFNGSDARKPTGAAEVRLRLSGVATEAVHHAVDRRELGLDGLLSGPAPAPAQIVLPATEMREVEIARRLYRSGESEYLVDGEVCRLRDVQDLLMDAGLGVKQYAIIEQGKIGLILNSKPTDRRVLIEEAAGVTKYKSRRRTAELKLEAAQQNLTRVDDIVYELEKQRASLKRQAGKARRYRKLREELRRWEKVLFTRRYHVLVQAIESARVRLAEARDRETAAAARVSAVEDAVADLRHRLSESELRAAQARDAAHARELEKDRREQQLAFDRQQVEDLVAAAVDLTVELQSLSSRREPARLDLEGRRDAARHAATERDAAAGRLAEEEERYTAALKGIEALELGVETARARVYAAINTETTLRNVIERAGEARERIASELNRLEAEASDLGVETERFSSARESAGTILRDVLAAIEQVRASRAAREQLLTQARSDRDAALRALHEREREVSAVAARLRSLEELEAARAGYGEAARRVLADPDTGIDHLGSVADYLDTTREYERAVEAVLGDLLQSVIVRTHDEAARGLAFVQTRKLGRCSFVVLQASSAESAPGARPDGVVPLASLLRVGGPHAALLSRLAGEAWFAGSGDVARAASAQTTAPVVTAGGEVFRGGHLVSGGSPEEARGILATKREIKELRDRIDHDQRAVERLADTLSRLDHSIDLAQGELAGLGAELHDREKAAIGHELQVQRTAEEMARIARRAELNVAERRRAEEERRRLEERQEQAHRQITELGEERGALDQQLVDAQRQLQEAREAAEARSRQVAEAKAAHAALGERALALVAEVARLEEASLELESRFVARQDEVARNGQRREELRAAIAAMESHLEDDRRAFASLQDDVRRADEQVAALQAEFTTAEHAVRAARGTLDDVRATVGQFDLARATAESDLTHLSSVCSDALQMSIEDVAHEIEALEAAGQVAPDPAVIYADDEIEDELEGPGPPAEVHEAAGHHEVVAAGLAAKALTAEEAIAELRAKIDRLGPVNMMAIEQFDELEQRHTFLTTQRQDLVESIAQTGEAIKRIEKTTRERFREAYTAINAYFETTFSTLFGGGRAGLVLLDEDDLLESGVDIIAQPPGKRLQNVSLLSGGEKALTAMALMFAIFRYRPSPFCLLDEIDAPLDDANIGRFIEMLYGMLEHTQFIIVTHSRKTMEIADRLYGVTMEEPGVSKLISLKLN